MTGNIGKWCFMHLSVVEQIQHWDHQRSSVNYRDTSEEWLMQKWLPGDTIITLPYLGVKKWENEDRSYKGIWDWEVFLEKKKCYDTHRSRENSLNVLSVKCKRQMEKESWIPTREIRRLKELGPRRSRMEYYLKHRWKYSSWIERGHPSTVLASSGCSNRIP